MAAKQSPPGAHVKPPHRAPWIIGIVLATAAIVISVAIATSGADEGTNLANPTSTATSSAGAEPGARPSPAEPGDATSATDAPRHPGAGIKTPPIPMQKAVELDAAAEPVRGLIARVNKLEAVQGQAGAKGEVAGPAVRFEITLENKTSAGVSLASTVVNVDFGPSHAPASPLAEPGGMPLPDTLAPGRSATGRYVFTVPADERDAVRILLDYSVGVPIVVFEGSAPR